jgi:hypothetical protein
LDAVLGSKSCSAVPQRDPCLAQLPYANNRGS